MGLWGKLQTHSAPSVITRLLGLKETTELGRAGWDWGKTLRSGLICDQGMCSLRAAHCSWIYNWVKPGTPGVSPSWRGWGQACTGPAASGPVPRHLEHLEQQPLPVSSVPGWLTGGSSLPRGLTEATDHHPARDDHGRGGQGHPVHVLGSQQQQLPHDLCLEEGQRGPGQR